MADKDTIIAAKKKLLEVFKSKKKHDETTIIEDGRNVECGKNVEASRGTDKFKTQGRLPYGQRWTSGFPVLDLGTKPEMDMNSWELEIVGEVDRPGKYSLSDLKKLGVTQYTKDFHCVTTWSKQDVMWSGISFLKIMEMAQVRKGWKHLIQYGADGYSTNVPYEDIARDDTFLAFQLDGKPIPREHGYVRLIIPHLFAWKTSKFLMRLEFSNVDKPGFWEVRGYHNRGNAFLEERYS